MANNNTLERLVGKRKVLGIGQAHLGAMLGYSQNEVSGFEMGRYGLPDGLAARWTAALEAVTEHYPRCGCRRALVEA